MGKTPDRQPALKAVVQGTDRVVGWLCPICETLHEDEVHAVHCCQRPCQGGCGRWVGRSYEHRVCAGCESTDAMRARAEHLDDEEVD